ncbi:deoxyguanosinetriphosphate triphosphohydrolase [Candidatus Pandoraea novymonadis]|uniref:Deoxyguanosinetriphosphate triphosphohydrolase-like protein n=1 Tax=Candidatus Pandoraea novymonadis TaxID=1808959 RepID=A0ABX5FCV4_9BURK|nr:deoxyguanosinetriphosphate triphosphohydrolase [Candidatus Pandoraea novymonadis]PSB91559.1 Deoxyguanosinetriphosphate triphosphohydrolase-like protein [Candidatus Pandoraea novymonadis]
MLAYEASLAPFAVRSADTRGRRYTEISSGTRSEFQRDRDRIIHSTAFRRLEYKTQVFVNHEGDLFRTRLTHSLEVAQIGRAIARNLHVNEDLVEAVSLAHDLGHTPFGHAGQDALNECMRDFGGFEHNLQSLIVVEELEEHYGGFNGLNLCFETREGILKHCSSRNAMRLGDIGLRFLLGHQPSFEAQIANFADEIAYNNHDIDDGLRSGLLKLEQLDKVPIWHRFFQEARSTWPGIGGRRIINETIRRIINALIVDLTVTTRRQISDFSPASSDDVRQMKPLVTFSPEMREEATRLKSFLFENLYRHYVVMRMTYKAKFIIQSLFNAFLDDPRLLPPAYRQADTANQPRWISHYIAGMTDRYAYKEYRRLFSVEPLL